MSHIEARSAYGTVIFDGSFVTIRRTTFLARATVGKGDKQIPLGAITAVQWKPAGIMKGFIQFTIPGGNEVRSRAGSNTVNAAKDENSVMFSRTQMPAFEALRTAVQEAMAARDRGMHPSAPAGDVASRMHQLEALRAQSMISEAEYAAKRGELLSQL